MDNIQSTGCLKICRKSMVHPLQAHITGNTGLDLCHVDLATVTFKETIPGIIILFSL